MVCHVKIQNEIPIQNHDRCEKGVLECLQFILSSEKVIKDADLKTRGTIFNKSAQTQAYTDDIALTYRKTNESFMHL